VARYVWVNGAGIGGGMAVAEDRWQVAGISRRGARPGKSGDNMRRGGVTARFIAAAARKCCRRVRTDRQRSMAGERKKVGRGRL